MPAVQPKVKVKSQRPFTAASHRAHKAGSSSPSVCPPIPERPTTRGGSGGVPRLKRKATVWNYHPLVEVTAVTAQTIRLKWRLPYKPAYGVCCYRVQLSNDGRHFTTMTTTTHTHHVFVALRPNARYSTAVLTAIRDPEGNLLWDGAGHPYKILRVRTRPLPGTFPADRYDDTPPEPFCPSITRPRCPRTPPRSPRPPTRQRPAAPPPLPPRLSEPEESTPDSPPLATTTGRHRSFETAIALDERITDNRDGPALGRPETITTPHQRSSRGSPRSPKESPKSPARKGGSPRPGSERPGSPSEHTTHDDTSDDFESSSSLSASSHSSSSSFARYS